MKTRSLAKLMRCKYMETDSELLELSAKAAGIEVWFPRMNGGKDLDGNRVIITPCHTMTPNGADEWNPLTDDGDALRLAVKLGISTLPYPIYNESERHSVIAKQRRRSDMMRESNPTETVEVYGNDPYAATRRAIVRAAAEIGREKQNEASNGN